MEDLSQYPYLFDRRRSSHAWLRSLDELQKSDLPANVALAHNWRMDHRVSDQREKELIDSEIFPDADAHKDFDKSVLAYFNERLCRPVNTPAYRLNANQYNRIGKDQIAPKQELVHLASLNALLRRTLNQFDIREAIYQLINAYPPDDPENLSNEQVNNIANALQEKGADSIRGFAGLLSDQLGPTEPHWWAAFAFEINDHLEGNDWTNAARILGLGHLEPGEWLIGWRYSPELAGPLYRPTVVEAGSHGFHFPSPPGEALGVTMPLEPTLPAVKEVIHAPLKGDLSAQNCIGRLGLVAQDPVSDQSSDYN